MKLFATFCALLVATFCHAQTISSFQPIDNLTGIHAVKTGLNLTLNVDPVPTVSFEGNTFNVTRVTGVWCLSDHDDLTGGAPDFGLWFHNASADGVGGINGWVTLPTGGILATGGSKSFSYSSLSGQVDAFGFLVTYESPNGFPAGGTKFVRVSAVPEPSVWLGLGFGFIALARRRHLRRAGARRD